MHVPLLFIFLIFLVIPFAPVSAQEMLSPAKPDITKSITIDSDKKEEDGDPAKAAMQRALDKLSKLPPDIQEELTDEAANTQAYCESNVTLSNFYDCPCFSLRMLENRIDKGPDIAIVNMVLEGRFQECISEPLIAGYAYNLCQDAVSLSRGTQQAIENTCACTGRKMAAAYKSRPAADMAYIENLFGQTLEQCREGLY